MLRVVDGPAVEREAEEVAASLRAGVRLELRCDPAVSPDQLVTAIARRLGDSVVMATVPATLDQVTHTILELATAAEPAATRRVDELLRDHTPGASQEALRRLARALDGRTVVVERVENLTPREGDEIALALRDQRVELMQWLLQHASLVVTPTRLRAWPGHRRDVTRSDDSPLRLQNGTPRPSSVDWAACRDVRTFELALALDALGVTPEPDEETGFVGGLTTESLRERLWRALPEGATMLLEALAVHGCPMSRDALARVPRFQQDTYERGLELALWRARGTQVLVDPAWSEWCSRRLPRAEIEKVHRELAQSFAEGVAPGDPSSRLAGLAMINAQRHLLRVGDVERAFQYAPYGAELFVELARDLSVERRFAESAALYERLLSKPDLLSPTLRGYAKHYFHYNRAHARPELEPVRETARGYDASLEDWPENALFWSRAVRAWYLAGDRDRARARLKAALQSVPPHPDKRARLIARTARRLAELGHPLDAIEVWGSYTPATPRAREDAERLAACLEAGWLADRLEVSEARPLFLLRPERFRIVKQGDGWRFVAERLGRSDRCATPLESARDFVAKVSDEVKKLLSALDRDLDDEQRERKGAVLSLVDVVASRLDAAAPPTTWVYGRLWRDEHGTLWLVSEGNLLARYEVPARLAEGLVVGDSAWLAEVDAGPSGTPGGRVQQLERLPRQDRSAVLAEWKKRLAS